MGDNRARRELRRELPLALEVTAVSTMAFGRPILQAYGDEPFIFAARGATTWQVVAFGGLVLLVPALVAVAVGVASRTAGEQARRLTHVGLVAFLGGLAVWWLAFHHTPLKDSGVGLFLAAVAAAAALGWLRWSPRSRPTTAVFLRYAGVAPVVLLGQFLFLSPTSSWLFASTAGLAAAEQAAEEAADGLGEDPPPVVMVVLDALPTATLLDGTGHMDGEQFPNLAELADQSTWYRNHSTVSLFTNQSVPTLTTGRYQEGDEKNDPENIFTLLGSRYEIYAEENLTAMCQIDECHTSRAPSGGLPAVLRDARRFWYNTITRQQITINEFDVPHLAPNRVAEAGTWFQQVGTGTDLAGDDELAGRPSFRYYHLMLPHGPWVHTDDGAVYQSIQEPPLGNYYLSWGSSGAPVGHQRHVLQAQATDQALGTLFDQMREVDLYDEALIIVTADHGNAFLPNQSGRGLDEGNGHHVAWVPLIIKAPGQTEGEVNDDNLMSIDIVPTVAEMLGIELPWEVDGLPASQVADERDPDVKMILDYDLNSRRPEDGESHLRLDASTGFERLLTEKGVSGSGPDAAWQRTEHGDLLREQLDRLNVDEGSEPPSGSATALEVTTPKSLSDVDTSDPLPLEILGKTDLPPETVVAYGLNGQIAALTEVEEALGPNWAHALLLPDLFTDGENELGAYVVEGPPGGETLHPVDLRL